MSTVTANVDLCRACLLGRHHICIGCGCSCRPRATNPPARATVHPSEAPVTRRELRGCESPECDRPHYAHGLCEAHYLREKKHGDAQLNVPIYGLDSPLVCHCPTPDIAANGGCRRCGRLNLAGCGCGCRTPGHPRYQGPALAAPALPAPGTARGGTGTGAAGPQAPPGPRRTPAARPAAPPT